MVSTAPELRHEIDEILPGVVADRRFLHQYPEIGFEEVKTAAFVAERLAALGVEDIKTGIARTGVTGLIRGTGTGPGEGKVALLRADMDALPIDEENDVEYRSTVPGKMHACGHDAHTSMLLGVTRLLLARRDQFAGAVKVLFQPAEENEGGASVMIEEGVLEDPTVHAAFGIHVSQDDPIGTVLVRPGKTSAAVDTVTVTIQGKGGHGAGPHRTVDSIVVGAAIVNTLQTIVSREIDPVEGAVITVGAFNAGEAANVIPDTAELRITVRSFTPEVREQLSTRIQAVIREIAATMRAKVEIVYDYGYPPMVNDPAMTELARGALAEVVGAENVLEAPLQMGAEDFSYFLENVPGCFWMVGTRNPDKGFIWGHHHPRFDIDEDAMAIGIETVTRTVLRYLATP